ncbi:MAG: amidase [Egibacteraceae bacterium]
MTSPEPVTGAARYGVATAARRIAAGELSSEQLVTACLERIEARENEVHAWRQIDRSAVLATARARDRETPSGPLHGVPVGVKDLIDTDDLPTTYGSPIYAHHRPERDAACVGRLRAAGAVVLGKTVTTEFALFSPGPTANPRDLSRTPGGSSSGSAAAVTDHMVPLALGTQTAGSVVRPASFCGVFGLKPTFGIIPTAGVKPVSHTLDTVGFFARSIGDLALAAEVLFPTGFDTERVTPAENLRIGFTRTPWWRQAEASTRERLEEVVGGLAGVELTRLPQSFERLVAAQETIMAREASDHLATERRHDADRLSASLRELLDHGAAVSDRAYAGALDLAKRCRNELPTVFATVDALIAPSVLGEAPEGLDATGDPLFCRAWTLLGVPTVSVPGLTGPAGAPLGVQVVAAPGRDDVALAAAAWLAAHLA